MSAALTFGSVGDILALCGIALELRKALSNTRGGAREYQSLHKDLDQFIHVLMQVIATYQQFERGLENLANITKSIVDECVSLVGDVLARIKERDGDSLQPEGSGSRIRDAYKKIEFSVREKETIQLLQDSMSRNVMRLTVLCSCAALRSAWTDNETLVRRIEDVKALVDNQDRFDELKEHMSRIQLSQQDNGQHQHQQLQQLQRVEHQLARQSSTSGSVLVTVKETLSTLTETKQIVADLVQAVAESRISSTSHRYFRYPGLGNATFEDPFGEVDAFPLGWVNSWEQLQKILEFRFENYRSRNAYHMVVRRSYGLEDDCNGQIISRKTPFARAFRAGMKVNMTMLFANAGRRQVAETIGCPRCGGVVKYEVGTCSSETCGMCYGLLDLDHDISWAQVMYHTDNTSARIAPSSFQRIRLVLPGRFSDMLIPPVLRTSTKTSNSMWMILSGSEGAVITGEFYPKEKRSLSLVPGMPIVGGGFRARDRGPYEWFQPNLGVAAP